MITKLGNMGGMVALFFDGACCQFKELPKPQWKTEMEKVYKYVEELRKPKENKSFINFIKTINRYGKHLYAAWKIRHR